MKKLLISVGLVVCLVLCFALPMCAPAPAPPVEEEAPPEEKLASSVRAWIATSPDSPIRAEFAERKLGIDIKYIQLSVGEGDARLKAEAPRFTADFAAGCISSTGVVTAKKNGWSIAYDSPTWRGAGPEWKDPDNHYWMIALWTGLLVGNKDLLDAAGYEMPEGWADLLDSKWKGQIVVPSCLTSGNGWLVVSSALRLYGLNVDGKEEGGWEYLKALDKNIHHYTKSGSAPIELVGRGEFMLGFGSGAGVEPRIEQGYPLVWRAPKEGVGYDGVYITIFEGTKEVYTCQKIVDVLGTHEAHELEATFGHIPNDPDVVLALYGTTPPKWVPNYSIEWNVENRDRIFEEWKGIIGGVAE